MLVTEESIEASFTLGLAGRIQRECFEYLDAPVAIVGAVDTPAIPLHSDLEFALLPNADKVGVALKELMYTKLVFNRLGSGGVLLRSVRRKRRKPGLSREILSRRRRLLFFWLRY